MELPENLLRAINNYLDGSATPEEEELVKAWYHSFNATEVRVPVRMTALRTQVAERIWSKLEQTLQEKDNRKKIPVIAWYRHTWVRVAVVALLVVAAGIYLWQENEALPKVVENNNTIPVNDIAPGGDKAILTLADGTKIVLDSAADGFLSQQGNIQVVKMAGGQLNYNRDNRTANDEILYNTMSTPRGGQYKLTLSDGTEVWLNAASSIRYPTHFAGAVREVEITGEVYFKVNKAVDAATGNKSSFRVIVNGAPAGNAAIEVYGTQFNVMAYNDETLVKTSLLEGSVQVKSDRATMKLVPGQQARMDKSGTIQLADNADMEEATAWVHGLFRFNNTDIQTLMRQLARWYDIDVEYEGKTPGIRITGKAPRNISLNSMLKILELSEVRYRIEGKKLVVMS